MSEGSDGVRATHPLVNLLGDIGDSYRTRVEADGLTAELVEALEFHLGRRLSREDAPRDRALEEVEIAVSQLYRLIVTDGVLEQHDPEPSLPRMWASAAPRDVRDDERTQREPFVPGQYAEGVFPARGNLLPPGFWSGLTRDRMRVQLQPPEEADAAPPADEDEP